MMMMNTIKNHSIRFALSSCNQWNDYIIDLGYRLIDVTAQILFIHISIFIHVISTKQIKAN